jgi:Dihaem cytochrome c
MRKSFEIFLCGATLWSAMSFVHADDGHRYTANNAQWRTECGSCHVAYPPQLLNAGDWKRIMARLDRHFGSDASVEPALATQIQDFLLQHSGRWPAVKASDLPRITSAPWFIREHDDVPARSWESHAVKSRSNCVACHPLADSGDFSDDSVQLPK